MGLPLGAGLCTPLAAAAATVLLAVSIPGVVFAATRGLSIDCGCFGGGGTVAPGQTKCASEITRDVGLLVLAAWLAWKAHSLFSLDRADLEEA